MLVNDQKIVDTIYLFSSLWATIERWLYGGTNYRTQTNPKGSNEPTSAAKLVGWCWLVLVGVGCCWLVFVGDAGWCSLVLLVGVGWCWLLCASLLCASLLCTSLLCTSLLRCFLGLSWHLFWLPPYSLRSRAA